MRFGRAALLVCGAAMLAGGDLRATDEPGSQARESYGAPASAWQAVEAKVATQPPGSDSVEKKYLAMRLSAEAYYAAYKGWTAPSPPPLPEGRMRNLAETPAQPRFALDGKDWPQKPGAASVCLWEDDKVAAMSFLVWGGVPASLTAAEKLAKQYEGARFSSSLIVGYIEHPSLHPGVKIDQAAPGAWDVDKDAFSQGIHFMSQSMTWNVDPVFEDGWLGPEWECAESIHQIDANIPGHKTKVLLKPGAYMGPFNVSKNWKPVVTQYFVAEVGAPGEGINPANQIDYFNIETRGCQKLNPAQADPTEENGANPAADNFYNLLNSDPKNPNYKYYRGWVIPSIHILEADTANPSSILYGKALDFFAKHRDDIWSGCVDDVALYGEERDTATLTTTESTEERIALKLTSKMDPSSCDYPLTVKVRLPANWKNAVAMQESKALSLSIVEHEGSHFALIRAAPDQGAILLQAK